MPGSTMSVFGEPDDYQAALRTDGKVDLLVIGRGLFRAQLTRIALPRMRLVAGVEELARIAFIGVPDSLVRISLPVRSGAALFRDGILSRADEIVTHGPGQRTHERTEGPCHWRLIWIPTKDLMMYGRPMIGSAFGVPLGVHRRRPTHEALRRLNRLHDDAMRTNHVRPLVIAQVDAMRGLEMDLIGALMECMQGEPADPSITANGRHAEIIGRFEDVLQACQGRPPPLADICAALGISDRTLRMYCEAYLGMGPLRYLRLRNMYLARRALRRGDAASRRVSEVARQYGFNSPGRFAASYRAQFGELPTVTLRRHTPP